MARNRKATPENGPGENVTLTVLLGNGDGTFGATHNLVVGVQPSSLAAADFNGDGILDVAVTNSNSVQFGQKGSAGILLGNGDGTFQAAVNYQAELDSEPWWWGISMVTDIC